MVHGLFEWWVAHGALGYVTYRPTLLHTMPILFAVDAEEPSRKRMPFSKSMKVIIRATNDLSHQRGTVGLSWQQCTAATHFFVQT